MQHARSEGGRRILAAMQNVHAQSGIIVDIILRIVLGDSQAPVSDLKRVLDLLLSILDNVSGLLAGKDRRCKDAIGEVREYLETTYFAEKESITATRLHALMTGFEDQVVRVQDGSRMDEDRFRRLEWWDFCQLTLSKCNNILRMISDELDGEWEVRGDLMRDVSRALDAFIPLQADDSPLMHSPVEYDDDNGGAADRTPSPPSAAPLFPSPPHSTQ